MQGVPFRQIAVVLVALIVILGAALFVVSWGDDDGDDDAGPAETTTTSTSTSTSTTTLPPAPTTSIPVTCEAEEPELDESTTTTTTTTTEASDGAPGEEEDEEEDEDAPLFPTLGPNSSVSTVGLDEVTFGLTVSQAERAAGTEMIPCEPVSDCYRVTPAAAPEGISFLVHEGTIERVDIVSGPIETASGLGIGTSGEQLAELFGDRIEREVLDTDTVDFIFVPQDENDADFRVVWTVVDGEVETFRAGRVPMVLDADPCAAA